MELKITFLLLTAMTIAACNPAKKSASSASAPKADNTVTLVMPSDNNFLFNKKPDDGIYVPGNEELTAIQTKYKDATLEQLKQGHSIYTQGACINCHGAKNIYQFAEADWKNIIDDMAQRTNISDAEKDAVYKYVLSIKATEPK